MAHPTDFYLKTCNGLHEVMWQTTSLIIDQVLSLSWKLFPFFLLIRFIWDEAMNRYQGVMDIKVHVKTLFVAILVAFFLAHYKWTLERFDDLIHVFYFSPPN